MASFTGKQMGYIAAWNADSRKYNSDRKASYEKVTSRGQKFKPYTGQF